MSENVLVLGVSGWRESGVVSYPVCGMLSANAIGCVYEKFGVDLVEVVPCARSAASTPGGAAKVMKRRAFLPL